jgi:hypothetical protein
VDFVMRTLIFAVLFSIAASGCAVITVAAAVTVVATTVKLGATVVGTTVDVAAASFRSIASSDDETRVGAVALA